MDSPYRTTDKVLPAGNFDEAAGKIAQIQEVMLAANPSFEDVCASYETYVKEPETLEERVSVYLSKNRDELTKTLALSTVKGVISIQEFVRLSLSEALKGQIEQDNEKNQHLRLFDTIMASLRDLHLRKLDCIDLSTDEGRTEALNILQAIIETLNFPEQLLRKVLNEAAAEEEAGAQDQPGCAWTQNVLM